MSGKGPSHSRTSRLVFRPRAREAFWSAVAPSTAFGCVRKHEGHSISPGAFEGTVIENAIRIVKSGNARACPGEAQRRRERIPTPLESAVGWCFATRPHGMSGRFFNERLGGSLAPPRPRIAKSVGDEFGFEREMPVGLSGPG